MSYFSLLKIILLSGLLLLLNACGQTGPLVLLEPDNTTPHLTTLPPTEAEPS